MKTIAQKIEQVGALVGTKDLNDWETKFVAGIVDRMGANKDTRWLSSRQVEIVDELFDKHFA